MAVGSDSRVRPASESSAGNSLRPRSAPSSRAANNPSRTQDRSRGPPRPRPRRESARARSGERLRQRRMLSRRMPFSTRQATESCRLRITSASVSGPARRSANRRAPPGVTVQSIVASRLPARSPESVRVSSRLARVEASIARAEPDSLRLGGLRTGRLPIWVFSI